MTHTPSALLLCSAVVLGSACAAAAPSGTTLPVERYPGTTLDQKLTAADAALGNNPGTLTINAPGTIAAALTLHPSHAVVMRSPVNVAAPLNLGAATSWTCQPNAALTVAGSLPAVFRATAVDHVAITGCTVHGPAGYLLAVSGSINHISLQQNTVDGMGLFTSDSGNVPTAVTDLDLGGNTAAYRAPAQTNSSAVYAFYVVGARIHGNRFVNTFHGVQWWGGNADQYKLSTGAVADLTIARNTCAHVVGSCVWGSMGTNILVTDNQSDTSGDVAFDAEGSVNVTFTHNTAKHCGNGCGAWFFASKDISFLNNTFDGSGRVAFLGKNSSVDPARQTGITLRGNTITCTAICAAVQMDAASDLRFEGNTVTNGRFVPTSFAQGALTISRNTWTFTAALPPNTPVLAVPGMIRNSSATIEANTLLSKVPQPAGTVAILATSADFNAVDTYTIRQNQMTGFAIGIATNTSGGNRGISTNWLLDRNTIAATTPIAHTAANPTESYRAEGNRDPSGAPLAGNTPR